MHTHSSCMYWYMFAKAVAASEFEDGACLPIPKTADSALYT